MTAIGAETICRAKNLAKTADVIASLTFETQFGEPDILDLKVHELRG